VDSLDSFLSHRIEQLVAGKPAPVDLRAIAVHCGVLSVEEREMIPEAVMTPEGTGFRIYVQSNFRHLPGAGVRQRFSLAHEIAHTLFFEERDGTMKPLRGAPTGDRLEAACHQGAGMLLVPNSLLRRELKSSPRPLGATCLVRLAEFFDVSVEVIMRRVYGVGAFEGEFAPVLLRHQPNAVFTVEYAVYPPWLKALLPTPRRGVDFAAWFGVENAGRDVRGGTPGTEASWTRETPQGLLVATPVDITGSLRIVELQIGASEPPREREALVG
jgi:hypothetical protein